MVELVPKSIVLMVSLLSTAAVGRSPANDVKIHNELADCVTIKIDSVSTDANVVSAHVSTTVTKPIGDCRCLSALATYSASVDRSGSRQVLQQGLVSLRHSSQKVLTLATEPSLVANKTVLLTVGCTGPL